MTGEVKELGHSLVCSKREGEVMIEMIDEVKLIGDLQLKTE